MANEINNNPNEKYAWISDIIHTNVVAKLRGRSFASVIDVGTTSGSLLQKLQPIFTDSRFYAFSYIDNAIKKEQQLPGIKFLSNRDEVTRISYDLVASVFDIHSIKKSDRSAYLDFIKQISDTNSTILFSDISANTFLSKLLLNLGSLFNPRLKSILSIDEMIHYAQEHGFDIIEHEIYKINEVWSAWTIVCQKKRV